MKLAITKTVITGVKGLIDERNYGHFFTPQEYFIDDSYTNGVDLYKILTVKKGKSLGITANTFHLADNTDVNVLPLGVCVAGSVNRHLAGEKEFKKRLPRKEELQSMPCINWLALNVEGYDVSGNRVYPTFELEDLRKPVYLGKNGNITFDKPLVSEYNTPIGYIASSDTIVIDLENRFPKHQTPVTKN